MTRKTVLIIAYYYPPCSKTASNRVYSFAKYWQDKNIDPIIVTRTWDEPTEEQASAQTKVEVIKQEGCEIHYVPFKGNLRTRLADAKSSWKRMLRKALTFGEYCLQNMRTPAAPFSNMLDYAVALAGQRKPDIVFICAQPFLQFKAGYLIHKKFGIPWIADYRDPWTKGFYPVFSSALLTRFAVGIDKRFEKKWLSTARFFTTVSASLRDDIASMIPIPGHVIFNGSNSAIQKNIEPLPSYDALKILYSGEVYPLQQYEKLISGVAAFNSAASLPVQLNFLGTKSSHHKIPEQLYIDRGWINITERIPLAAALKIQAETDVFVMLSHKGLTGIVSSKLFDYLTTGKKFILFENDHDILEEIAIKSNLGIITDTMENLQLVLQELAQEKQAKGFIAAQPNWDYIETFTRQNQAYRLAELIHEI